MGPLQPLMSMPCPTRHDLPILNMPPAHPVSRRPGLAAPRIWSAARSGRRGCGSRSASASSTRSTIRASTSRRSGISVLSSPAPTASGPRSSASVGAEAVIAGSFVEAAEIYANHPAALQLRAMNIIYETTKERGTTVLIPTSMVDSLNPASALVLAGQAVSSQGSTLKTDA